MSQESRELTRILRMVFQNLPQRRKSQLFALVGGAFAGVWMETGAVGLLAYFASAVTDPAKALVNLGHYKPTYWPDSLFPGTVSHFLLALCLLTVAIVLFKNVAQSLLQYLQAKVCASISGHLGEMYLRGLTAMPYVWHLRQNSSELITTYAWRDRVGNDLFRTSIVIFSDVFLLLSLSTVLAVSDPINFLLALTLCATVFLLTHSWIQPRIKTLGMRRYTLSMLLNKNATSLVHGIKEVKLQGDVSIMHDLSGDLDEFADQQANLYAIQGIITPLFEAIGIIMLAIITLMLYSFSSSGARITGTITLFAVVAWRGLPSIGRITGNVTVIRESLPSMSKFFNDLQQFLDAQHAVPRDDDAPPLRFDKTIAVHDVAFRYENASALAVSGVSFTLEKGRTLGIIGASGAGKSTLVDILIGLLAPDRGDIRVDGVPLAPDRIPHWRQGIGYVSQAPYIADDSLLNNIAFGIPAAKIDRDWAKTCCVLAHVEEFFDSLPLGLDSPIGERGACLSGGQRQRVAIARALYKKPEIIVFDEATSALDIRSEQSIQQTIMSLHGKTTMVLVAHRLSTVKHCDNILWLENGAVRMFGPPEVVLAAFQEGMAAQGPGTPV